MIDKDNSIIDALRAHPQARDIFFKYGMGCISCLGSVRETIENGAKFHGVDVDALLAEINALLEEKK